MKKWVLRNSFMVVIACFLGACSGYRKIEKSPDWRVKYEAALKYYENGDYVRASTLLESVLPITTGLPEGEKAQFYYAYSQFHQRLYLLSSHHFQQFYETYARSALSEEAEYMYAYSLYASSPDYNLDQTSSLQAVESMQRFLNRYPDSQFRANASKIIDELQFKLERKNRENALQYFKIGYYKAAVVAFTNFTKDFPDSRFIEEMSYMRIMAQFELAEESIFTKQKDRYNEVVELYKKFIDRYPESGYLRTAEKAYIASLDKLNEYIGKN